MPNLKKNTTQTKQTKNIVKLTGKLCELEVTRGTKANPNEESIRLSGAIMLNNDPNFKINFRNKYPIRKYRKDGEPRKDYPKFVAFAQSAKSMATAGADADTITLTGRIVSNDFYTNGNLIEATVIEPTSIAVISSSAEEKDELIFQGMVRKQSREVRNEEETGRIRVEVLGIDGMGTAVPFKFIVPEKYADAFENGYVVRTCANFFLRHELRMDVTKQSTGGIGEQWTEGSPRIEWVLCGASDPIDEDDEQAIPAGVVKEGLAKRAEALERLKEYNSNNNANVSNAETGAQASGVAWTPATTNAGDPNINLYGEDPDELPF